MKIPRCCSTAAALAAALLLCSLLLPTQADCPPGGVPYHCKSQGTPCNLRKKSECAPPYKCDKATGLCAMQRGGSGSVPDEDDNKPDSTNPIQAACPPGQTPYHCKPKGAACTPRKKSECETQYRCDLATRVCVFKGLRPNPPASDDDDDDTPATHPVPAVPANTPKCILPVSPYEVRTGTPKNHQDRHPGDTNYKNVQAVDLATNAGQAVYAVQDGTLSSGGSFAISSGSSNKWGWSFEIASDDGNHFFYTHVKDPLAADTKPGARVTKGQLLGWVAVAPHAPNHLHFAHKEGNPCAYLKDCRGKDGQAPNDFGKCFE